ncbi:putative LRR receptor-like serine/threonine-protein kinase [Hordeum vulgare]|nr:putative LRR receptor-like serine/threonine-protein kinase [Hordeum vulgare]
MGHPSPRRSSCLRHGSVLLLPPLLLLTALCSSWRAAAQAQAPPPPQTDPTEAAAVSAILRKLGLSAPASWNISGNPCSGAATDDTPLDDNPNFNPAIKCDCTDQNGTVCHVTRLKINSLDAAGPIPEELRNLTHLIKLDFRKNSLTGPLPAFIGELTALKYITVGTNALSGPVPKELWNLTDLVSLALGSNHFNGTLPDELGKLKKLQQLYIDSNDFTGPLPAALSQLTNLSTLWASDNSFTGQIPDYLGSLTNMTQLRLQGNSFQGPIPRSLSNLIKLTSLRIGDIVNGSSSLVFVGNMTTLGDLVLRNSKISDTLASVDFSKFVNLTLLDLSFNNITGQMPQSIFDLPSLNFVFLGNNSLSGSLPATKSPLLTNLDFSYNHLSGSFPSWITQKNVQLNLVANDFVIDSSNNSVLPLGLNCLQRNTPCSLGSPHSSSLAVDCGGSRTISGSDGAMYQADNANLGASSYYVGGAPIWGVSSTGRFMDPPNGSYIIYSSRQFQNTLDSGLFQTARMSPSSLRYYGIGLENGNYTVTLQFAEFDSPDPQAWKSRARRVFDIYLQGERREQNFDIRKAAGGKSFVVVKKQYVVPVVKNFLEIHLFWAGKGTCCIPTQGYYGPAISALSATPNFIPTVHYSVDNKRNSKTGMIVGVVIGVAVCLLAALAGVFVWRQKRRKLLLELEELYTIVGRPNVFSYGELRSATENFDSSNLLGEGGYGSVYKGKLSDGRVVAVKQLSESSNQGKVQFATEIETISRVQHRNLVKLYGCCLESKTPLLVYECLENGSLDHALFGKGGLNLDWPRRFEICLGIARGIAYLHEESSVRIVHRDIKASNVLLDADLNPKISDFGLAKLYDGKKTHVSTKVAGTFGYLAPEYAMRGHMTEKIDVFAFGVVALEIVAGESNHHTTLEEETTYIFEKVWDLYENGNPLDFVDPKLSKFKSEEVLRVIRVALICTQGSPHRRPSMSRVVSMLTGDAEMAGEEVIKPSYITEWQVKAGSSSSYTGTSSQAGLSSSSTTQQFFGAGPAAGGDATPATGNPSPMFTSIIDEGR